MIGSGTFIGAHANLGHDSRIGKNNIIANNVIIAGWVETGDNTIIWLSTTVKQRVKIGSNVEIGMASLVLEDIPDDTYGYGQPFKPRKR